MTEQDLRQKVADIINGWVGSTRGDAKHLEILSIYNNHKPLARSYPVKVSDAHCATTTSAAYIAAGMADWTGTECGVEKYIEIAKKKGIWVENDAYRPSVGDACVYCWEDSGVGDCTGDGDHIGIVTAVSGNTFVVTEGNINGGQVGKRTMQVNGRYIRGFFAPDFAAAAKALSGSTTKPGGTVGSPTPQEETVYIVKLGDTLSGIAAKYGTTYQALAQYNGLSNPNLIHVGQQIRIPGASVKTWRKGDKVRVAKGAKTYTGGSLASWVYSTTFGVIQVDDDRVVIGINGAVTAAVHAADLTEA